MTHIVDCSLLDFIDRGDVEDHVFELYSSRAPPEKQHLGYVDNSKEVVEISLDQLGMDLQIRQSLTELNSSRESSTTGFIVWQSSVLFVEWMLSDEKSPFFKVFQYRSDLTVAELGAGISGICATVLGPKVARYIATDQKHILRLLMDNFQNNAGGAKWTSSTVENGASSSGKSSKKKGKKVTKSRSSYSEGSKIDFIEYDWEYLDLGRDNYDSLFLDSGLTPKHPDIILACDTIYNEYLIPFFIEAVKSLLAENTIVVISLQLRDSITLKSFVDQVVESELKMYSVPVEMLSEKLAKGFVIYVLTK
ncbi:hypothetical protein G9P44_004019 [Scheffersomyces stipitis]|nr:hypothetical protein G9P44_004019 [Scheffersomyces stipitis]